MRLRFLRGTGSGAADQHGLLRTRSANSVTDAVVKRQYGLGDKRRVAELLARRVGQEIGDHHDFGSGDRQDPDSNSGSQRQHIASTFGRPTYAAGEDTVSRRHGESFPV